MRIYIAGPMRGLPLYNFPAFDAAAAKLRAEGHEVVSPAEMDREAGLRPETLPDDFDWNDVPSGFSAKAAFRRDMDELVKCDAIALLPGWRSSYGATVEADVAKLIGLQRIEFAHEKAPRGGDASNGAGVGEPLPEQRDDDGDASADDRGQRTADGGS